MRFETTPQVEPQNFGMGNCQVKDNWGSCKVCTSSMYRFVASWFIPWQPTERISQERNTSNDPKAA